MANIIAQNTRCITVLEHQDGGGEPEVTRYKRSIMPPPKKTMKIPAEHVVADLNIGWVAALVQHLRFVGCGGPAPAVRGVRGVVVARRVGDERPRKPELQHVAEILFELLLCPANLRRPQVGERRVELGLYARVDT